MHFCQNWITNSRNNKMKRVCLMVTYMYINTFSIDKVPKTVSICEKRSFQRSLSPVLRKYVVSNFQVVVGKLRLVNEGWRGGLQVLHHDTYLVHVFTLSIKTLLIRFVFAIVLFVVWNCINGALLLSMEMFQWNHTVSVHIVW